MCMLSHQLCPCVTLWTLACQASLSMECSRREYWSELPCCSPGDLPIPRIKPTFDLMGEKKWVQSLGWEEPLEEGRATHSSILPWRIPWTEKPGRLRPHGSIYQIVTTFRKPAFVESLLYDCVWIWFIFCFSKRECVSHNGFSRMHHVNLALKDDFIAKSV